MRSIARFRLDHDYGCEGQLKGFGFEMLVACVSKFVLSGRETDLDSNNLN